jgi:hypothetical protein
MQRFTPRQKKLIRDVIEFVNHTHTCPLELGLGAVCKCGAGEAVAALRKEFDRKPLKPKKKAAKAEKSATKRRKFTR